MKVSPYLLTFLLSANIAYAESPVLDSISFSQETFDISSGAAAATTVTMGITSPDDIKSILIQVSDSMSDLAASAGYIEGGEGVLMRTSGDAAGGIYSGELEIPAFRPAGDWAVVVTVEENNGDMSSYSAASNAFPGSFGGTLDIMNTGDVDMDPPVLSLLSISPAMAVFLDDGTDPQTVTFRAEASDDRGIDSLILELYLDDAGDGELIEPPIELIGNRISGDATSGVYEFTREIPASVDNGTNEPITWKPAIRAVDVSNRTTNYGTIIDAQAFPGDSDQQFEVIEDEVAPVLISFSVNPTSVDVSDGSQTVVFRAEAVDLGVGIDFMCVFFNEAESFVELEKIENSSNIYEGELRISTSFEPGSYPLSLDIADEFNNSVRYSNDGASDDIPFPSGSSEVLTVINTNLTIDNTPPALGAVTFSSDPFPRNTPLPATISVTISATDDISGVASGSISFFDDGGAEVGFGEFDSADIVEGTSLSGTYTFNATIDVLPEEDEFITSIVLSDSNQNQSEQENGDRILLAVTPRLSYEDWVAANAASLPDGQRGATDDPDGDSLPNAIEFALGFDPSVPNPAPAIELGDNTIGLALPADLPDTASILITESSTDLINWTDLSGSTTPLDPEMRIFLRLVVWLD